VLNVHSEIHIGLQWCVNYCSTWTRTGTQSMSIPTHAQLQCHRL